jgi:hypothetical protein
MCHPDGSSSLSSPATSPARLPVHGPQPVELAGYAMKVEMSDYAFYEMEAPTTEMLCFDLPFRPPSTERGSSADSVPCPHTDNSNYGFEHMLSLSPDLSDRDHAESQPLGDRWFDGGVIDWGDSADDDFLVEAANLFRIPSSGGFTSDCDTIALREMVAYLEGTVDCQLPGRPAVLLLAAVRQQRCT